MSSILKMAGSSNHMPVLLSRLFFMLVPLSIFGALSATIESDVRAESSDTTSLSGSFEYLSLAVRKTFSDSRGDRLILFINGEVHDNLHGHMLHEGYLRYKGPLSRWNITIGRFALPFGTITTYPSSRYLWAGLEEYSLGIEADDGALFSGVMSHFDYALSLTRGVGAHGSFERLGKGLLVGKLSFPLNSDESVVVGASGAVGTVLLHDSINNHRRHIGSIDLYLLKNGLNCRAEIAFGELADGSLAATLLMDYPIFRRLEINSGYRFLALDKSRLHRLYSGFTTKYRSLTMRGGYSYENGKHQFNAVNIQLYFQYSIDR